MNKNMMAWAAGLFEGEGCITITQQRQPRMSLASTDEDVVRSFHDAMMGVGSVNGPMVRNPRHRPQWCWTTGRHEHVQFAIACMWERLGKRRKKRCIEVLGACEHIGMGGLNARKTHCPQGHPYSGDNLILPKRGGRKCRACTREAIKRHQRNNPELYAEYKRKWRERQRERG